MCGIAGIIRTERNGNDAHTVAVMSETLSHRGPDDRGAYSFEGVTLGHRRLAIIDPKGGRQPMCNEDGTVWIVFNGAIFNYLELRQELISHGHVFESYSDTEVIVHLYEQYGEECLSRMNGMFSFVLLDQRRKHIFAARDRFGLKPFYYYRTGDAVYFASEPKAFFIAGVLPAQPDPDGLEEYITFQFTLGSRTMFRHVAKLEPGHSLSIDLAPGLPMRRRCWWDLHFYDDLHHTKDFFLDKLTNLVNDSVKMRMRADVPVGSYLSGGLDSSTVALIASGILSGGKFHTFTGSFDEGAQFDESAYARAVAEKAGSIHHELSLTPDDFIRSMEDIIYAMDEPCAGPGVFPQYCVARMASEHVKVVLGGQGGDEIFIGYARYLVAYLEEVLRGGIFETFDKTRHAVSLESIIPNLPLLKQYVPMLRRFWSSGLFEGLEERYFKLLDRSEGMRDVILTDYWKNANSSPFETFRDIFSKQRNTSYINRMCYFDIKGSLPALLQVDDRTGMAFGLESRLPLLDYRIAELFAAIPPGIKFQGGQSKALFREAVRNLLPKEILQRKDKMGFPVPLGKWFQGSLKEFVSDILLSEKAVNRGMFNPDVIRRLLGTDQQFSRVLWGCLCLELWFRAFIDKPLPAGAPGGSTEAL